MRKEASELCVHEVADELADGHAVATVLVHVSCNGFEAVVKRFGQANGVQHAERRRIVEVQSNVRADALVDELLYLILRVRVREERHGLWFTLQ